MIGDNNVPAGQVTFWFRCGDGMFKSVLEGKGQVAGAGHSNREYYFISSPSRRVFY